MGETGQTPGTWLSGAAGQLWSPACRAALIECGINPDNFGTYADREKSQSKARKPYREQRIDEAEKQGTRDHEPGCPRQGTGTLGKSDTWPPFDGPGMKRCLCHESAVACQEMRAQNNGSVLPWAEGNSESGHISQNALYQSVRGDPCSNVRPTAGNAGGYGYQDDKAFCMDHMGRSSDRGTDHYEITRREAQFKAHLKELMEQNGSPVVPQDKIEQGARGTIDLAVRGGSARTTAPTDEIKEVDQKLGEMTPERKERTAQIDAMREQVRTELKAKEAQAGPAGQAGMETGHKPNSPSGADPKTEAEKVAAKCIFDAWKEAVDEMRNELVDKHSVAGQSPECAAAVAKHNANLKPGEKPATGYSSLSPDERKSVDKAVEERGKAKMDTLKNEQKADAGKTGDPNPTAQQCLEYQANWLQQNRDQNGNLLPIAGRVPGKATTTAGTTGAGTERGV
jgi:hypothetical protein